MSGDKTKAVSKACDRCGRPAAIEIGDECFCEECYQIPGSCCPEFGGDDLWEIEEKKPQPSEAESLRDPKTREG